MNKPKELAYDLWWVGIDYNILTMNYLRSNLTQFILTINTVKLEFGWVVPAHFTAMIVLSTTQFCKICLSETILRENITWISLNNDLSSLEICLLKRTS